MSHFWITVYHQDESIGIPLEVDQRADREVIHVPKVAELYKEIYGWVDRGNQQLSYHNTEFRSVRKQNRVLDSLIEMYVLVNGHTL